MIARRDTMFRFMPVAWLFFLTFPITNLIKDARGPLDYLLGTGMLLVFLWLYFWVFRAFKPQRPLETFPYWNILAVLWCFMMFFAGMPFFGWNGTTFLVYAASLGAFQRSLTLSIGTVAAVLAVFLWSVFVKGVPAGELITIMLLSVSVAIGNHFGYAAMESGIRMKTLQQEKENLARIAERERIARDLHDLLGHTLSVIVLKAELASKLIERNPERAKAEIKEVEQISREALTEVRLAVQGYKGTDLKSELGRAKIALDAAGIKLEYLVSEVELGMEQQSALQLIFREAITNIIRHSRAKHCQVSLEEQRGNILLKIIDDGVGVGQQVGNGMKGMRERTEALGGKFTVKNQSGTVIEVCIPKGNPDTQKAIQGVTA
ncbi:sensor histidine kinase [Deinococcus roseus]|uniref:Two-component sensor histidine kinase n=1 Tax=Deinococcus roseus TaxID=392414 RepID=A0ABQ2CVG7_9DEIO|nr:sensor histidine kinase [Deinococcus roseus]GGJ24715.1 two-component sensor histidine kinase [Deinococcus roseus]